MLQTTKGDFVFKYYENRSKKHVLFEVNILNYLRKKKYPVPAIIKNSFGKFTGEHKKKPFVIIKHINGEHSKNPNNFFQYSQLSKVVKITAKLHNITRKYRPKYFKDHEEYNVKYCWNTYKKLPNRIRSKDREKWLKNELDNLKFPNSLPRGLCHADLNCANFLFEKGKIVGILDFDMSFYTILIYDIASLIYWWAWPPKQGLKTTKARFITKEYSKYRFLNNFEKNHIYDALKLIILLGISWSEEDDFEQEKIKIDYLNNIGRSKFYNLLFE
ncbi:phosphotransferase [Candidatus Parcubacteria bacterium]|nr:phosphotransferase [Candidatus Parcubacteria bacterium]